VKPDVINIICLTKSAMYFGYEGQRESRVSMVRRPHPINKGFEKVFIVARVDVLTQRRVFVSKSAEVHNRLKVWKTIMPDESMFGTNIDSSIIVSRLSADCVFPPTSKRRLFAGVRYIDARNDKDFFRNPC